MIMITAGDESLCLSGCMVGENIFTSINMKSLMRYNLE
jgi:hypothetical protein